MLMQTTMADSPAGTKISRGSGRGDVVVHHYPDVHLGVHVLLGVLSLSSACSVSSLHRS